MCRAEAFSGCPASSTGESNRLVEYGAALRCCTPKRLSPYTRMHRPTRARILAHAVCRCSVRADGKSDRWARRWPIRRPAREVDHPGHEALRACLRLDCFQYRGWRSGIVARLDFCLSSEWATPHADCDMEICGIPAFDKSSAAM